MDGILSKVQRFSINLSTETYLLILTLRANGESSYRDAAAFHRLFKNKYGTKHIHIITDTHARALKGLDDCYTFVQKKIELLDTIRTFVKNIPDGGSLLFCVSAHGYSKYVAERSTFELNNRTEYLQIGAEHILDTELFDSLYKDMKMSVRSLCLIDTCHSGTMLDLEFLSHDGIIFRRSNTPLKQRPQSVSISACTDDESAGEDISSYGGWGGKLTCHVLDYVFRLNGNTLYAWDLYISIRKAFLLRGAHEGVRSSIIGAATTHPIISYNC